MALSGEQKREYQRRWLRKRRETWIQANGPCRYCGSLENLEVDHIDPATKIAHNVWSWSEARRAIELKKCQVLCATCHQVKTAHENSIRQLQSVSDLKHGASHAYNRRGCRCEACCAYRANRFRSSITEVSSTVNRECLGSNPRAGAK